MESVADSKACSWSLLKRIAIELTAGVGFIFLLTMAVISALDMMGLIHRHVLHFPRIARGFFIILVAPFDRMADIYHQQPLSISFCLATLLCVLSGFAIYFTAKKLAPQQMRLYVYSLLVTVWCIVSFFVFIIYYPG